MPWTRNCLARGGASGGNSKVAPTKCEVAVRGDGGGGTWGRNFEAGPCECRFAEAHPEEDESGDCDARAVDGDAHAPVARAAPRGGTRDVDVGPTPRRVLPERLSAGMVGG